MKKVNFGGIAIKDIEGKEVLVNVRSTLGNQMYMRGDDIAECELGREIYHSEGEVELTEEQCAAVARHAAVFPYLVREAIVGKVKN